MSKIPGDKVLGATPLGEIHQVRLPNGKYLLQKEIRYYSQRYKKWVIVPSGYLSDGATGTFDIASTVWWIHDRLCDTGKFEDGTPCTNWQASQIAQDVLNEEAKEWKKWDRTKRWVKSSWWFWGTWLFGGGKARKNGMR